MGFDVMREPWIDCVTTDGRTVTLGIRELLLRAHELREVRDISPLQEYGIYRLLCVIAMDMLKPRDSDDMEDLLDKGRFDAATVDEYIALCEKDGPCFDLFDPLRPFMQDGYDERYDEKKNIKPVRTMLYDIPSGNNHIHFYHSGAEGEELSYAQCARALCAVNVFCTSGLQGPSTVNGAPPIYVIVKADDLYRMIIVNCINRAAKVAPEYDIPGPCYRWNPGYAPGEKVASVSLLEGMTFKPRRICLIDNGRAVEKMYFQKGADFNGYSSWRDPHTAINDKRTSIKPSLDRDTWRNIPTLFSANGPITVSQAVNICGEARKTSVIIYGLVTRQAAMDTWLREEAAIPNSIIKSESRVEELQGYVALSEKGATVLKKALHLTEKNAEIKQTQIVMQSVQGFYAEIRNALFTEGVSGLAECGYEQIGELRDRWKETILETARRAFKWGSMQMGCRANVLKAAAQGEGYLNRGLYKELGLITDNKKKGAKKE